MAIKTFDITYDGNHEEIQYETELSFGETEAIINQSLDLTDIQRPKVKLGNFRMQIVLKTLRKAPFNFKTDLAIKGGSEEEKEQPSESTPTVQPSTDGPKEKQTNTQRSSSKSS